jgi:DNA gyrase/topoisomerase IV subunit A
MVEEDEMTDIQDSLESKVQYYKKHLDSRVRLLKSLLTELLAELNEMNLPRLRELQIKIDCASTNVSEDFTRLYVYKESLEGE